MMASQSMKFSSALSANLHSGFGRAYYPNFIKRCSCKWRRSTASVYDHIWVTEHHFAMYGGTLPHPPTFMAALARTTKRIRLGVAINVLPLHNYAIDVAESYAMVDVISNSRSQIGVGKGSEGHKYQKFGIDQSKSTGRMFEGVEVIRQAWSDQPVTVSGKFYNYQNGRCMPSRCSGRIRRSGWAARTRKIHFAGPASKGST